MVMTRNNLTIIVAAIISLFIVTPATVYGMSFLGGWASEPLVSMLGIADSSLLVGQGNDLIVIYTSYVYTPVGIASFLIRSLLSFIIAVGVCYAIWERHDRKDYDPKELFQLVVTGICIFVVTLFAIAAFI